MKRICCDDQNTTFSLLPDSGSRRDRYEARHSERVVAYTLCIIDGLSEVARLWEKIPSVSQRHRINEKEMMTTSNFYIDEMVNLEEISRFVSSYCLCSNYVGGGERLGTTSNTYLKMDFSCTNTQWCKFQRPAAHIKANYFPCHANGKPFFPIPRSECHFEKNTATATNNFRKRNLPRIEPIFWTILTPYDRDRLDLKIPSYNSS